MDNGKLSIKDPKDIKYKGYMLRYNIIQLICKLNEEGLKSKKGKIEPNPLKT